MKTETKIPPSNRVPESKNKLKTNNQKSLDLTTLDQINESIPFNAICCKIKCRKFNFSVNAF